MTRLVLIRHGESVSTVERRIGGVRTCGGLSPLGRKQAEALATRLARTGELRPDVLVASTIRRAVETAEIIAPAVGDLRIEQIVGATVMVVCHAGVIDVGLRSFLDVSMFGVFELSTTNTSITELLHTGPRWRMIRYNDAAHLEGLPHETNSA